MSKMMVRVLCSAAVLAILAVPAMAEVQNVKLDGQINIRGFLRDNYSTTGSGGGRVVNGFSDVESRDWYNTVMQLGVAADLTDNVMAKIGILNERDWQTTSTDSKTVEVETAAIIMKEVLYSPLTVKAGRMPIQIADGLVLGDGVTNESTLGSDYSAKRSFDTIHGILDFDPLTLIAGTLKVADVAQASMDDVDGYLLDAIYKFGDGKTVMDTYVMQTHYNSPGDLTGTGPTGVSDKALDIYTVAGRLMSEFMNGLMLDTTLAVQFGDYQQKSGVASRDLKAWAANFGLSYMFDAEFAPKIGAKYIYRSGSNSTTGDYQGWLPLFTNQENGIIYNPITNTNSLGISGSMMPLDRLTLGLDLWFYQLAKKQDSAVTTSDKKAAGSEVDMLFKYAYTEDVTMGLSLAYFMPGDYYRSGNDKSAKQIMAELGVRF